MERTNRESESISFLWDSYEHSINNYSLIMRILHAAGDEERLIRDMPRVFVENSAFDLCTIVSRGSQGFFTVDGTLGRVDAERIRSLSAGALSPFVARDVFGCSVAYIYPLTRDARILGFLLLGKRAPLDLDPPTLRELRIVCDLYNQSLLAHGDLPPEETGTHTLFERLIDAFPDALLLVDRNGSIVFANRRAKSEFAPKSGFLVGEKIEQIVAGMGPDLAKEEGVLHGEVTFKKGTTYKVFRMDCFPVAEEEGIWKAVVLRDVVEKRIKEEEHLAKEKMESMAMLAGGIAHDFNNLLTGILGYASLIKNFLAGEEKLYRYAEAIETSAQRAAKLAQHLLNFSRRQRRATGVVDVNVLMEDILFLVREIIRDVEIEYHFDPGLSPVKGDEAELQNVFLNLCMNARDAMGGKGTLTVRTERKRAVGNREFALVEIADTGPGIDEAIRARIFEPYFTTKENGTNLGMGLYLVNKVITEHAGFIELESERGRGTTFRIYLPLPATAVNPDPIREEAPNGYPTKHHRILIVDDEEVVRNLIKGILADGPAEVLEAPDGETALALFQDQQQTIDLVILDMIMPGMKGDEVLKALRTIRGDIKVIVSSGYMSEEQRTRLAQYRVDAFLDKPFRDKDVLQTITDVLSGK